MRMVVHTQYHLIALFPIGGFGGICALRIWKVFNSTVVRALISIGIPTKWWNALCTAPQSRHINFNIAINVMGDVCASASASV